MSDERVFEVEGGTVTARVLEGAELTSYRLEVGFIDAALTDLGLRCLRPSMHERVARALYQLGVPLMVLEQWFGWSEAYAEDVVEKHRTRAVRLMYLCGWPTREISRRLEVALPTIAKYTADMPRHKRIATGRAPETKPRGNAVPPKVVADVVRRRLEGECFPSIAKALGLSRSAVARYTRGVFPQNVLQLCDLCRPGPKAKLSS